MNLYSMNVKSIADEISGEEISEVIVKAAIRKVNKLRKENFSDTEPDAFEYLAALVSIRDSMVMDKALSPSEVSAGEIRLKSNLSLKDINMLIREEQAFLSEELNLPDFAFIEVKTA